jgi:hypothetical protein
MVHKVCHCNYAPSSQTLRINLSRNSPRAEENHKNLCEDGRFSNRDLKQGTTGFNSFQCPPWCHCMSYQPTSLEYWKHLTQTQFNRFLEEEEPNWKSIIELNWRNWYGNINNHQVRYIRKEPKCKCFVVRNIREMTWPIVTEWIHIRSMGWMIPKFIIWQFITTST